MPDKKLEKTMSDDNAIDFDPTPITRLMVGYLGDFGGDISSLRRTFRLLSDKKKWTREELDLFSSKISETCDHFNKTIAEIEEEAGVKIP